METNDKSLKAVQPQFDSMIESEEHVEDAELAVPVSLYTNTPEFSPEDITPPVLKLLQALSPEVVEGSAKSGNWILPGYEQFSELTIVPIGFAKRREYRTEDTFGLSCVSYDGEYGEGDPGGKCSECPMNKWSGEGKGRKPPACVFMYSYVIYVEQYNTLCVINFKRTGLGVGKSLNSLVARAGLGKLAVRLFAKIQTGGKGVYYIPQVMPISEADEIISKAQKMAGM